MKPASLGACLLCAILLIVACQADDPAASALHATADSLMCAASPDSALRLLQAHDGETGQWPRRQRMRHELLRAKAMNKAYVDFTTDSVMREVTDYYDRHGTPNERMEAHYLLGCTYRDLGEAPRAIDCYLDAVNCADTTATDCDYLTMARVSGQMAELYHQQLLLSYEVEARRMARYYDLLAGDTLYALHEQKLIAGAYILQNNRDSAESVIQNVIRQYQERGLLQEELRTSMMLMRLYLDEQGRLDEAKQLIDRYDALSDAFDDKHELHSSLRKFYYYKGMYFEGVHLLDSAEYYYRKIYRPGMTIVAYDPLYRGLLSVFKKRHQADSIAKYAQLYCEVNDSSIALKDQEITAQISASYNYNRYQKLAFQNEVKAYKSRFALILLTIFVVAVSVLLYIRWQRYKAKRRIEQQELERLKTEFSDVMERYSKNRKAMLLLEKSHQDAISSVQKQLDNAQQTIDEINQKYEESIALFRHENETLKGKIEELGSQQSISKLLEKNMQFAEEPIVKRLLELADNPRLHICKREWEEFIRIVGDYYPEMLKDLKETPDITNQELYTALLVILNMRTDDIARLIDVSGQRVTNIKSSLNLMLFGVKSARPLYENLTHRYSIYLFEK